MLFINAAEHFVKGKRQNQLSEADIKKIIASYQNRTEAPRYISTAVGEEEIDLAGTNAGLVAIEDSIKTAMHKHNNEPQAGYVPRPAASRTAFSVRSQPSSRGCF